MPGTYIALKASTATTKLIQTQCADIKDIIDDLHVTLMYDEQNDRLDTFRLKPQKQFSARIAGFDVMGEGKWRALVCHLISPEIIRRHNYFKLIGLQHSYPKFMPHLSIKYGPTSQELDILKQKQNLIGKIITFDQEYAEPITE